MKIILLLITLILNPIIGCSGGGGTDTSPTTPVSTNNIPVAVASPEQIIQVSTKIFLDGSNSYDPDADPLTYQWNFSNVPVGSILTVLTNATTVNPSFTPDVIGAYEIQLLINDGTINSIPVTTTITAVAATTSRGAYTYSLQPGAYSESTVVEFHPDGSYAVILERFNKVHIYNWVTQTTKTFDLSPVSGVIALEDIAFEPNGNSAILVGHVDNMGDNNGIIYRLDDTIIRQHLSGNTSGTVFTQYSAANGLNPYVAIQYPWKPGSNPVILERTEGTTYTATLKEFNTTTGNFSGLVTATVTSAGCNDIAFVNNLFGSQGILVVCGMNGADNLYYTEIAGSGEWSTNLGNNLTGNVLRVSAHNNGDYALFAAISTPRIYQFQNSVVSDSASSPYTVTKILSGIKFQNTGQRALIVGRAVGAPLVATILEYRNGAFACTSFPSDCGLTDISIPDFDLAPYFGTSNTYLLDASYRPGCDGGLIVGGDSTIGLVIEFQITGEILCH